MKNGLTCVIHRKGQDDQDRQGRHDEQDKNHAHLVQSSREADLVFLFNQLRVLTFQIEKSCRLGIFCFAPEIFFPQFFRHGL